MSEFTDYLCDVFAQFGNVTSRAMFGGHGLYFDNCMFGLVADDTLYLKVDENNLHYFTELDLPVFEYEKSDGHKMAMSYRMVPESIYEDQDEAAFWAGHSWEAAKRVKSKKKQTGKKARSKRRAKKQTVGRQITNKKSTTKKSAAPKTTAKESTTRKSNAKNSAKKRVAKKMRRTNS